MVAEQPVAPARKSERITYIDGVRGVAIGLVLVFHSWGNFHTKRTSDLFGFLASQGFQGVSLFFVISGFCLSYPVWKRYHSGAKSWFTPSSFFMKRCLRILPPYYVALFVFSLVKIAASRHHSHVLASREGPLTAPDIISHIFLVHNLTPYINSIDGMFWSLGLEWQWYWVFPLVLLLCIRSKVAALLACLALTVAWHIGMHDLWGLGALPPRLFEFCCGICAASFIVSRPRVPLRVMVAGFLGPLAVIEAAQASLVPHLGQLLTGLSLWEPLFGLAFASMILLGYYNRHANALLSLRPLVWLGIVSYSVYLVHGPVLTRLYLVAPASLRDPIVLVPLALMIGILSGAIFHYAVERPFMRPSMWTSVTPVLARAFGWTDRVWMRWIERPVEVPAPAAEVSPSLARSS